MNESGSSVVAEVDTQELEELDGQDSLCNYCMAANPKHHPGKVEQIESELSVQFNRIIEYRLQDEMTSDGGSRVDCHFVAAKEVPDINSLKNPEDDPVYPDKHMVQGEGRRMSITHSLLYIRRRHLNDQSTVRTKMEW